MRCVTLAEADEIAGDLGSARHRLMSHAQHTKFDPAVCERVARLCVKMHDPVEAGRWYFLCDSRDGHAIACIEAFLTRHKRDPRRVVAALPHAAVQRTCACAGLSIVAQRIAAIGGLVPDARTKKPREAELSPWTGWAMLAGLVLLLVSACIGLRSIARWLWVG